MIASISFAQNQYILGPGDVLEVHAWDATNSDLLIVNPVLQGLTTAVTDPHSVTVSRDGKIFIPMIGAIRVEGMSIKELEAVLRKGLQKFSTQARVSVMVKIPKKIKVSVAGEISYPGLYEISDGIPQERSVLNYIRKAGGLTDDADQEGIKVVRSDGATLEVNLRRLVNQADLSQNVILGNGDTIIVPQAINKVYVLGQVTSPGGQKYIQGARVADYIGMAGGILKTGASDNVGIVRGTPDKPVVIKVKLNRVFNFGREDKIVTLLPGDIIYVPQSWYYDWADVGALIVGFKDARDATRDLVKPSEWSVE
jgi:polysaccharide export outer membrane protein